MKISTIARRFVLKDSVKEWVEKKFHKLDRLFDENTSIKVTLDEDKSGVHVEVTILSNGVIYRAQVLHRDVFVGIDKAESIIKRQIRKNRTRLEKRLKLGAIAHIMSEPVNGLESNENDTESDWDREESEFEIVREKKFDTKPMSADEAILQMNLLNHQFYVFRNSENDQYNLVYRRSQHGYGLIELD